MKSNMKHIMHIIHVRGEIGHMEAVWGIKELCKRFGGGQQDSLCSILFERIEIKGDLIGCADETKLGR